jgi:hypothetical protein
MGSARLAVEDALAAEHARDAPFGRPAEGLGEIGAGAVVAGGAGLTANGLVVKFAFAVVVATSFSAGSAGCAYTTLSCARQPC